MTDGASAPLAFDAVLLVHPVSEASVAGLRLVERAAFTLARAGAQRLLCIGGTRADLPLRMPDLPTTWTARPDAPETQAWIAGATAATVVMDAATVTDRQTLATFVAATPGAALAADAGVLLWRCPNGALPAALVRADGQLAASTLGSPPVPAGVDAGARPWRPPADGLLLPAHDAAGRAAAERALFTRLGRDGDGWFTRLVDRRISRALTRLLLPTGVTPNQVTIASIAIGIFAGALFATGIPAAALAGAVLFLASTIVDGCDGELARLTFRESAFGARLDIIGDNVVHLFLFGGIAAGLYRRTDDPSVALAGGLLVAGVVAAMAAVYACVVRREPNARQRALFEAFASREFAYLLVVLTLLRRLDWFLWISVAGTYVFVIALIALGGKRRAPVQNA